MLLFSCSVISYCLPSLGLQHDRPPCPYLPKFTQVHVHGVSDAIQSSHPLSSFLIMPSVFPSIRILSSESAFCIRWSQCWSFSGSITPSNGSSGLISYRINWFGLFSVQGTLKSLLQHHSSKASILWHSAFFVVQLSHQYMITGKTIALTIQTFVGKVISLLSSTLPRFVIAFLPKSKRLLISWLQSPSPVILEPKKRKSVTDSTFSLSICQQMMAPDAMILVF